MNKKTLFKTISLIAISFLSTVMLFAQKNEKKSPKIEVKYLNISSSGLSVVNSGLKFSEKGRIFFSGAIKTNLDDSLIEKVTFSLSGKDENGKEISLSATGVYDKQSNEWNGSVAYDNPLFIGGSEAGTNILARNASPVNITSSVFSQQKTSFAVLLNGSSEPKGKDKCFTFLRSKGDEKEEGDKFIKLDTVALEGTFTPATEKRGAIFGIVLAINNTKKDPPSLLLNSALSWGEATMQATVYFEDNNGNTYSKTLNSSFNLISGNYELKGEAELKQKSEGCFVTAAVLHFKTSCGDTFSVKCRYSGNRATNNKVTVSENWLPLQKTKSKEKDNFKVFTYKSFTVDGYNIVQVSLAYNTGSSIAKTMTTNMTVIDCDGNEKSIAVKMKYDSRTGTWSGSVVLGATKCAAKLAAVTLNWENACGDKRATETVKLSNPSSEWKCEDKCLKTADDSNLLCGSTDHF